MRGRLIAVNDNRVAWEYRDNSGNCKHGIAANFFEAENQLTETEKKYNKRDEFSPTSVGSSQISQDKRDDPLCKFGPGGRYVRDYTPKDVSLWPPGVWLKRIFAGCRALFIVAFNGVRRRR